MTDTLDKPAPQANAHDARCAARVRQALGASHDDYTRPVAELVAELKAEWGALVQFTALLLAQGQRGEIDGELPDRINEAIAREWDSLDKVKKLLGDPAIRPKVCHYCDGSELDPDNASVADWGKCPVCRGQGEASAPGESGHD